MFYCKMYLKLEFIYNEFNYSINLLNFKKVLGCFDMFNQAFKSVFI